MRRKRKLLLLSLELICLLGVMFGVWYFQKRADEQDANLVSEVEISRRYRPSLSYEGQSYPLKRNMSTLLLIGTDNYIDDAKQHEGLTYNFNLADFLIVLVFDHSAKTIAPFQICRDSMCEVQLPSGNIQRMQITLAHTYGSGHADSCEIVQKAVQGLLLDAPIDSYLAFTMDTVPYVNDLLGGVTVTLEDDVLELGSEYVKGASITLKGTAALRFLRYRDTSLLDDNLRRMAHHRLYLTSLTELAREASADDPDLTVRIFQAVEKYIDTNLSVEEVSALQEQLGEYTILPAVTPDGKYQPGEDFAEFIVDADSLWDCVHSVFCA